MKDIQAKILNHYGIQYQLRQTQEECAELIAAINHVFRGRISPAALIEELADVEIMLDQLKLFYGDGEWETAKIHKLTRARDRITVQEYEAGRVK